MSKAIENYRAGLLEFLKFRPTEATRRFHALATRLLAMGDEELTRWRESAPERQLSFLDMVANAVSETDDDRRYKGLVSKASSPDFAGWSFGEFQFLSSYEQSHNINKSIFKKQISNVNKINQD